MRLSTASTLNAVALVVTAAAIVVQIVSGSDLYPTIPPGPIILLAGAVLVVIGPRRWAPIVGVVVPAFLIVGGIIASAAGNIFLDQLTDLDAPGIFIGTVLQILGAFTALATGVAAVRLRSSRGRT